MSSPASPGPVPDPVVIAATIAQFKEVFATLFIGFAIATAFYGMGVLQCFLYFRNYPKDSIYLKLTVGTLLLFDTLSSMMTAHALYTFFVLNFGNLAADAYIPWSFALENGLLTIITIISQCFYAWQIWKVSLNGFVTGGILLLGFVSCGMGLYMTFHLGTVYKAITGSVQGLAACCDIAITIALVFYLRSKRERGVLSTKKSSTLSFCFTVQTWWQPFHQLVGKLYVNSIVASLNARKTMRGNGTANISAEPSYAATPDPISHLDLEFMSRKRTPTSTFDVGANDRHSQLDVDIKTGITASVI
ncbi:hypothetical protein DFH08DRAFT_965348 [Mycena albidolilacea]|uniref:DUF6534 domain-containing protein n=1 Tax=Mycena albidolilacea TaxID=1033008 RepID=A0AAD6ZQH2_9AGAR|nr:hypothetical protein DFH08DRAFT_965348 [Mycena albidolilacea]